MTIAPRFDSAEPQIVALMTEAEATAAERDIITTGNRLRSLLVDFYERRGWAALGYASWRGWASARLGESERRGYQELTAGLIERELLNHGSNLGEIPERHLRPLAPLRDNPDALRETWDRANEIADEAGKPRTAAHVAQAVAEYTAPPPEPLPFDPADEEPLTPFEEQIAADVQRAQQRNALTSQESTDWYTPAWCIAAVRHVLGSIALDPASSELANRTVGASRIFTAADDGLTQRWRAPTVFLNPPYNGDAATWCEKAQHEYRAGHTDAIIILVFAKLGYQWFEELFDAYPTCLMRSRISFVRPDGSSEGQAKHASAFVYIGPSPTLFRTVFVPHGRVFLPSEGRV
ncbi:MAG: DNA N-6-adenine-methyltransferase [Chloroflexales bacterium]